MNLRFLPAIAASLVIPASAATVEIISLGTSTGPLIPAPSSVNQSTTITVDLSNLTGLTTGSDIAITFATSKALIWLGGFGADTGDLTLNSHARFTLAAGVYSAIHNETWSFGPVPWTEDMNTLDPVGYMDGPESITFTLIVPWNTDLSAVSLTLTDLFSVTGVNARVNESNLSMGKFTLTTTSVPEPSAAVLVLFASAGFLRRRR